MRPGFDPVWEQEDEPETVLIPERENGKELLEEGVQVEKVLKGGVRGARDVGGDVAGRFFDDWELGTAEFVVTSVPMVVSPARGDWCVFSGGRGRRGFAGGIPKTTRYFAQVALQRRDINRGLQRLWIGAGVLSPERFQHLQRGHFGLFFQRGRSGGRPAAGTLAAPTLLSPTCAK